MRIPVGLCLPLALAGLACAPTRLETRVNGRPAETLQAACRPVDGGWELSLRLPAGHWEVLPDEAQRVELRPGEPRETLVWRVPQARWNQARPFTFSLRSGELRMAFSVRYPGPSVVPEVLKELAVVALHGFSGKHL